MVTTLGAIIAAVLLVLGCAPTTADWGISRAEQYRDDGKLESALRLTERELQVRYDDPPSELVNLHIAILREMGRDAEATAFRGFVNRYVTGIDTSVVDGDLSWHDCNRYRQPGWNLITSWGEAYRGPIRYEPGSLVATFDIQANGRIENIKVARAGHPGAAWLIIRTIATANVSKNRVAHREAEDPDFFPVSLCLWHRFERRSRTVNFRIRDSGLGGRRSR